MKVQTSLHICSEAPEHDRLLEALPYMGYVPKSCCLALILRDFPRPEYWPLSQFKNEQKFLKMVYIIPNFLILHFGENFMKIRTKIAKLQMHENSVPH